jgi:hypothetical protein
MSERNLFDDAARVLAMPIPRRKALGYVAAGFAGALLPFLWPKEAAAAYDYDFPCVGCYYPTGGCDNAGCYGRRVDDPCTVNGQIGHCAKQISCKLPCCRCVPGPAPDAPNLASIPDVPITREDSLAAGNCLEGTDWVASWFPGRHSISAREVAAAAISRGKPRLARYIARTAHVVQRGAQV